MIIFYVWTDTQLINAVNIKTNITTLDEADCFILSKNLSSELLENVISSGIFKKVYVSGRFDNYLLASCINYRVNKLFRFFSNHFIMRNYSSFLNTNYSHIFAPGFWAGVIYYVRILSLNNPNLKISFFEEGMDNYKYNKYDLCYVNGTYLHSHMHKIIWKCLCHHSISSAALNYSELVQDMYLYQPKLYLFESDFVLKMIPPINNDEVKTLISLNNNISKISEYFGRKVFYFLQDQVKYTSIPLDIIVLLNVIPSKDIIIKKHPRYNNVEFFRLLECQYPDVFIDSNIESFETIAATVSLSDKILITRDSSSIIYPKFIFGSEPNIIYTYNLYSWSDNKIQLFDSFTSNIKSIYSMKERIHIPKSCEDMKEVLSKLTQE